jgi:hypothetical protein
MPKLNPTLTAPQMALCKIRPLRRSNAGKWFSRDGRWTFMRHWTDPHPQRWFAYLDGDAEPDNEGAGHTTLAEVAQWAESRKAPSVVNGTEEHLAAPSSPKSP